MKYLGDVASVITLVLFIMYIIGRVWILLINSKYMNINVSVDYEKSIEWYDTFDINLCGSEVAIIEFEKNIRILKIYEIKWKADFSGYNKLKEFGKVECIPANTKITIKTVIPEGIPSQLLFFEFDDGIQGELPIGADGRSNGTGISSNDIKIKRTIKSWIYYLVK